MARQTLSKLTLGGNFPTISAYSLGAGEYAAFGPFEREGWMQSDGYIYLEASHAEVKFGVLTLPS